MTARRRLSRGLAVAAALLLFATTLAWYARVALLDAGGFADRAVASVRDASVRELIADRVTDQVVLRHAPDLTTARPFVASAVAGVVGGAAFGSLLHRAVLDAHRTVLSRDANTFALTINDVGTVASAALETFRPKLAAEVEASGRIALVTRRLGSVTGDAARLADRLRALAYVLAALTLAAAVAALAVAVDRRDIAARLGRGAAFAGLAVVVGCALARSVTLTHVSGAEQRAAAGAIWEAYLGDLRTWGWLLAASGAVVAAAASAVRRPVAAREPLRAAWAAISTEPARPWARLLRAIALIAAGLLVILRTSVALQVAAALAGAYLLYAGVVALLRLVPTPSGAAAGPRRSRARALAAPIAAVAVVLIVDAVFLTTGATSAARVRIPDCNGAAALCDRPLDEVVLPATHNSMGGPLPGWFASQQDRGIAGQLQDGIRGLLIDTHYADKLANGRVRTYFASPDDLSRAIKQDGVSRQTYEAAVRLRERAGFRGQGTRGMYLCHTFCELGATPLADGLKEIHDFLVMHPGQIVVVVNQDYVTPRDFVGAVDAAGLAPYAFTPPSGDRWPTLRDMIDQDRRLVVLAENHAGAAPWYQLAYERLLQETPFSFSRPAQLADHAASCRDNRGPADAPLFLINNWVTTDPVPRPGNASVVNAYAPLLARAQACRRMRGHLPNLIAVDFYKRGDLFRVVDRLNGL
ncbi:MAG TPA: hypothetical protein VH418_17250 [Solirubrobacteraceae bacterium]